MPGPADLSFGLQVFNMLNILPSPVQSRIPAMPFRSFLSLTKSVDVVLAEVPPALPPRRSHKTSGILSSNSNYTGLASTSNSNHSSISSTSTLVSDLDMDSDTLIGASSSTSTATTRRNSVDCRQPQFQRFPAFIMDDRQLPDDRQRAKGKEVRLPQEFGASTYDAVNQRWSPSGIKWRYARQGTS
jgi:hypothetical protein